MEQEEQLTVDTFAEIVSDRVEDRVSGRFDALTEQVGELQSRVQAVEVSAASKSDIASLQGELVPVGQDVGTVLIEYLGQIFEVIAGESESDVLDKQDKILSAVERVESGVQDISGVLVHPALDTNFADYTVTEALLLLLFFFQILKLWIKVLRRGLSWLM